ncbi:MAG: ferredoxin [Actinomycetota bacterium]|nr:ferredoxin [Actinomycetota bacterium]
MRVRIDGELCQGHQMCAIVAPDLFGADDEGYGVVLVEGTLPPAHEEPAIKAEASCPERAVIVER